MMFPISLRNFMTLLATSLIVLLSSVTPSLAQHLPERDPRLGERRFNANTFKASHNAYERSEQYYEQLDDMNCWSLELDIAWRASPDRFIVGHEACSGPSLDQHLPLVAQSATWREKVTVLWFQVNNNSNCPLPNPVIYESYLQNLINRVFGWSRVYTPSEFYNLDGGSWPSWQELVRRGKNLIIVTERATPHPNNGWFFEVTYTRPTSTPGPGSFEWNNNITFFNSGQVGDFPLAESDYWASRIYPERWCGSLFETESEWYDYVRTRATIVATNCLSSPWTQGHTQVHPPQPTFVNNSATGGDQYGTRRFPFRMATGLVRAIRRTANYGSSTELWISPGDYNLSGADPSPAVTLERPMIFKAPAGGAVIR